MSLKDKIGIKEGDLVSVLSLKNELVCIGDALMESDDVISNEKGCVLKTKKVFMERKTYPKNEPTNS